MILPLTKRQSYWISPAGEFHQVSMHQHMVKIWDIASMSADTAYSKGWLAMTYKPPEYGNPSFLFIDGNMEALQSQMNKLLLRFGFPEKVVFGVYDTKKIPRTQTVSSSSSEILESSSLNSLLYRERLLRETLRRPTEVRVHEYKKRGPYGRR